MGNFGLKETAHGIFYNNAGQLLAALFQFLLTVVLVNMLSVKEYGIYVILFGITPLFGLLLYFAIPPLLRFLPDYAAKGNFSAAKKMAWYFLVYSVAAGLAVMAFTSLFHWVFSTVFGSPSFTPQITQVFGVVLFFTLATEIPLWSLNALGLQKQRNLSTIIYSFFNLALAFAALQMGFGLLGVFTAISISMMVYFALLSFSLKKHLFDKPSRTGEGIEKKKIFKYTVISYIAHFGDLFVMLTVDIMLLGIILGPEQTGLYGFATKIPTMIANYSPSMLASAVLFPFIVNKYSKTGNRGILSRFFKSYIRFASFFVAPITVGAIALGMPLIELVFSKEYLSTFPLFAAATIVMAFVSAKVVLPNIANALDRPEIAIYSKVFFVFSSIAIILFAKELGIFWAFAFTGAAMLLMTLTEFALTSRLVSLPMPKKSLAKTILSALIMGIALIALLPFVKNILILAAAIIIGAAIYFGLCFLTKPFEKEDRELFERTGKLGMVMNLFSRA